METMEAGIPVSVPTIPSLSLISRVLDPAQDIVEFVMNAEPSGPTAEVAKIEPVADPLDNAQNIVKIRVASGAQLQEDQIFRGGKPDEHASMPLPATPAECLVMMGVLFEQYVNR